MFDSFSEASRLYAQNYPVIEVIKSEFERDVNAFLDAVREEISLAVSGRLSEKVTKGYRYWWVGEEKDKDLYPQFWLESGSTETVYPGAVKLTAIAPAASQDQLRAFAQVATRPEFTAICRPGLGGPWSLFTAVIKYEDEHPVQRVSSITARLLSALNDLYETTARTTPSGA